MTWKSCVIRDKPWRMSPFVISKVREGVTSLGITTCLVFLPASFLLDIKTYYCRSKNHIDIQENKYGMYLITYSICTKEDGTGCRVIWACLACTWVLRGFRSKRSKCLGYVREESFQESEDQWVIFLPVMHTLYQNKKILRTQWCIGHACASLQQQAFFWRAKDRSHLIWEV